MAEEHAIELLERLHETEKTILHLKIEVHGNRAELKASKDEAAACAYRYLEIIGTKQVELSEETFKVVELQDKVAELEKTIQDITAQESSSLTNEAAELKAMLKSALDLKVTPKPELPTPVMEEPEKDVAPYDCIDYP
ncbi:hypothetical protein LTR17_015720 [Elasticomyces elasticus]|nr:hypothetical protein LTR17_015720 [Elasticomyces elasticus]